MSGPNIFIKLKRLIERYDIIVEREEDVHEGHIFARFRFSNKDGLAFISPNRYGNLQKEDVETVVSYIEDWYAEQNLNTIESMIKWLKSKSIEGKQNDE